MTISTGILHKTCIVCGKQFDTPRSNPRKTCSKECQAAARSRAHKGKQLPSLQLDVTGQRYGELTAIRRLENGQWLWQCSCGKTVTYPLRYVRNSKGTPSCGHVVAQRAAATVGDRVGQKDGTTISALKAIVSGKRRANNTTGVTGVTIRRYKASIAYRAQIVYQGKTILLGEYSSLDDAAQARKDAEHKYFMRAIDDYEEDQNNGKK